MSSGKKALTSKLLHATMTMMRGGGGQQQQQKEQFVKKVVVCGRAKRGLYHGKTVRFGNNVSDDGGNKTRRKWSPNAKRKRLYSEVLNRMVPMQVTAHALKCIDKAGGLDNYVLEHARGEDDEFERDGIEREDDSSAFGGATAARRGGGGEGGFKRGRRRRRRRRGDEDAEATAAAASENKVVVK